MGCGTSLAKVSKVEIPTMINGKDEDNMTPSKRSSTKLSLQNESENEDVNNLKYYFDSIGLECEDIEHIFQLYSQISEPRNIESILQYFDESHNRFFAKFLGQIQTSTIDFKDFVILMYYYVSISNYYCKYFILY